MGILIRTIICEECSGSGCEECHWVGWETL